MSGVRFKCEPLDDGKIVFTPVDEARERDASYNEVVDALEGLLREYDRNICMHEELHRGGFIWTICDQCGQKWADDQGGFKPYVDPPAVGNARLLLGQEPITGEEARDGDES